ncbi:scavenger receptor cysteine-rich type 1 protein M130-like [Argopecten irradians]|uniref:scavenger receptor cysteine-rich type 1 protein M130-like n=1 Tax=Argopecten irradians TaxID=31199 RepID=UPI00371EB433
MILHLSLLYLLMTILSLTGLATGTNVRIVRTGLSPATQGILEVNRTGSWKVVCNWGFGDVEARIACRELGFIGGNALPVAAYGPHSGVYTAPFRGCKGEELSLLDCNFDSQGNEDICRSQDTYYASVNCYTEIPAIPDIPVNLTHGYHGNLSYYQAGVWGQVCLTYWDDTEASVACRELGYHGGVATRAESVNGRPFTLTGINCHGNESRLVDCKHTVDVCYNTLLRAAVVCYNTNISIHLEEGDGQTSRTGRAGRMEITYDGIDGVVAFCGLSQKGTRYSKTPSFLCRQLGFATGTFIKNRPTQGSIYWAIEECNGDEDNIFMCRNKGWLPDRSSDNCTNDDNIVVLACHIGVNLGGGINTDNVSMGMVEIYTHEKWTTVCSHHFDQNDAKVVCRQLGFTHAQVLLPDMFGRFRFVTFATDLSCDGSEAAVSKCEHATGYCLYTSHASVLCTKGHVSTAFNAYLSHGHYGTVMIDKYGMAGTVCRHGWDNKDSQVLCRQLGYRGGVALGTQEVRTRYNPIWLSNVNCTGHENAIQECVSDLIINTACGTDHSTAGSLCYNDTAPTVNLVDGSKPSEGRAEVTYAALPGTICDNGWSASDANVLCKQMGYPHGTPDVNSHFGPGVGPVYLDQLACDGTESSILACPSKGWNRTTFGCDEHKDDAGVTCFPWARLENSRYYGALTFWSEESTTYTIVYGLVCDDGHFGNVAAHVFCKEQGFPYGIALRCSSFGNTDKSYAISEVDCDGTETTLADCKHSKTTYCPTNEYISVVCALFLIPSPTRVKLQKPDHGYVLVSHFNQDGFICSEGFDDIDATVICKMNGYIYGAEYRHHTQTEKLSSVYKNNFRWLSNVQCNSTATTLDECDLHWGETCPCDYRTVAGVFCLAQPATPSVELEDGTSMEGRVVVKVNKDMKGLICGDYFSHTEADVLCRHIGYRSGIALDAGSHGNGAGTYFLDAMTCEGNETNFLECALEPDYQFVSCRSGAATVKCYNNVRLSGGATNPQFGRIELHNGQRWVAVCDTNFDDSDAKVVCKALGFLTGRSLCCSTFGPQPMGVEIEVTNMNCDGTENRPQDCAYDSSYMCPTKRYASVLCSSTSTVEDVAVRLRGDSFYGPVEVRRYGLWGYVCASEWDDADAEVTCRTLGYRAGKAVRNYVTDGEAIILGHVKCRGVEQHFGDCILDLFGADAGCYKREAIAGVICINTTDALTFQTRGTGKASTLYIKADDHSIFIDKSQFDDNAASLVCQEMDPMYVDGSVFGFVSHIPGVVNFRCLGNEDNILKCIGDWNPTVKEAVTITSVNCHRGVKLSNGRTHYGIVEVYKSGSWGTICGSTFSHVDAGVVCRNLGFDDGISLCCSPFGKATSPVIVTFLECAGTEVDVRDCPATYEHSNNAHRDKATCDSSNDAVVVCYTGIITNDYTVSINKPTSGYVGDLTLTYIDVEGRICADGWDDNDAKVACKQEGFKYGVAYQHSVENGTQGNGPYWTSNYTCSGLEGTLQECGHAGLGRVDRCNKLHYAGAICFDAEGPSYRISGGDRDSTWGRIEIRLPGEGWGSLCNTHWGKHEAEVVCRQFGFDNGQVYRGEYNRPPPLFVYDVKYMCTGNEDRLTDCPHDGWLQSYVDTCSGHQNDAGVRCRMADTPPTMRPEQRPVQKDNTGVVVGVVLGCVIIVILVVILVLVLKWRQSQKDSPRHEQFQNVILNQGRDGSLQLHNPLHDGRNTDSESLSFDNSGAVSYRSSNTNISKEQTQYTNPTYETASDITNNKPNDTGNLKYEDSIKYDDVEHNDTLSEHDSPELAYAKLGLPTDSHVYESCDHGS